MKVSPLGWQRRVRPCSPLLPLLLGLPLLVALVRPAAAQTERLLVGNLNQNDNLQLGLSFDIAQGFTTGVRPASLRSVEVSFDFLIPDSMPRLDQLAVGIYTSSNGQPGSRVGALTNPATWGTILRGGDPARTYLFTTAGIRLEPNTEYFVVIDSASSLSDGDNGGINLALSHDEDAGGLSNWSIDDSLMTRLSIDSTSNWVSQRAVFVNRTLKFSLTGIELPGGTTEGHSTLSLSGPAAALEEGDSGVRKLEYTVSLSEAIASRVFWKVCFSTNTRSGRATLDTSGGNSFQANADYRVREGHKTAVPSTKACTDNYQFKSSDTSRKELFYAEIKGDTDREPDEDIVATLEIVGSTPADVTLGTRWHVHRIENDDNGSQSLVINPSTVALTEGQSGTFTVRLSEAPNPSNRAVEVLIADSYQLGSDQRAYIPSLGNPRLIVSPVSLRFTNSDWNSAKTFTVTAGEDADLDDETETLRLRAEQSSGNFTNLTAAVPLSITDVSNRPVVSFGSTASSAGEDAGKRNVRVNLSPAPLSAITLLYTVGGTARAGTDFNIANSGSIQVAANATRVNIPVSITDDTDDESAETVILTLGSGTGYSVGSGNIHTLTINDDDDPGVRISAGALLVTETGGTASYTVVLNTEPTHDVTVTVTSDTAGAATVNKAGGTAGATQTLTFTAGASGNWGTAQTIRVRGVNDDIDNENDRRAVTIAHASSSTDPDYTIADAGSVTVTVTDEDGPPTTPVVSIGVSPSSMTEGGTATFTLTAIPAPTASISVVIDTTAGLRFTGVGSRTTYIGTSGTRSFTIDTNNDNRDEASGPVTLTVRTGTGYVPHSTEGSATVIVNDNDDPSPNTPVVSISGSPSSMTEGGTATFTLTASPAPTASISVAVQVTDSGDFASDGAGSQTVTVDTTGTASFTVPTTDDTTDEPNGTITATVNTGTGYSTHNTEGSASVTVNDNDNPGPNTPVASFGSAASSAGEDGGTRNVRVSLSPAPQSAITLSYTVGGTATAGTDFSIANSGSVQAPANTASVTIPVTITEDTDDEANETVILTLGSGTGYSVGSGNVHTLTINDNDDPGPDTPVVSITGSPSSMTEGDTAMFTLTASPAPTEDLLVTVQVMDSGDFASGGASPQTVSISPLGTAVFTVVTTDDDTDEPNGTITATVNTGTGYVPHNTEGSASVTVNDNDDPGPDTPVVSITGSPSSMTEGETATFTLTASPAPTEDISVTVQVMDSGDFASGGTGPQTVTVDTSGTVSFTVVTTDDEMEEPNGMITATVNTGTGYSPHNTEGSASVTVNDNDGADGDGDGGGNDGNDNDGGGADGNGAGGDNDGADGATSTPAVPPTVSISRGRAVITEGDHAVFTLTASPAPREDLPVTVQVMDSGDFASGAGLRTVSIPPSGAASFTVPTMDDHTDEPNGTITATVNTGTGYAPHSSNAVAVVTVNDNDVPGLRLPRSSLTVARGGSSSYTIRLSTRPSEPVTVSIRVVPEGSGLTVDTDPETVGNQTTLTFTAADWNVPQWVVVTAPEQAGSITLTHTATGDHYDGVTAAMTVRVADIDPDAVRGWHVRWGRTLSQQVVDALQDRFAAVPTPPGLHLRVAGEELSSAVPLAENRQVLAKALGFEKVTAEQLVEDSAFSFSPAGAEAARFALWGRGALSSFSGEQDTVSLEGEASTALVGAEWRAERWQAGAALSRSWGSGSYGGAHRGEVDTSGMTGLFPYGRYALTPRLGIWAVVGWGWGQLSLQPDGTAGEYQPGTKLSMTAVGMDGLLLDGGAEGLSLVSTAEVLRVRTVSEDVADLAGSEGVVSRRRLGLEATRAFPLSNGAALSPSLSVGIREDGGDGETGFGLEMGAGLLWADPARGVRGELQGRSLLSHVEEEFREQGLALSFAWDPTPGNRGPSFSLSHAVGATAAGGMDALLQPTAIQVLDDAHGGQQFAAELAYGVSAFADRFTLSPGVGLVLSPDGAVYSLGWALAPYAQQAQAEPWELALQGEREQRSATTSADHSLTLRFSLLF